MNPRLPDTVAEFGAAAEKAFIALGGIDHARAAEADPGRRDKAAGAIEALGVGQLDPFEDLDSAAAAGELARVAGRVVLPYPVASVLAAAEPGGDSPCPFAPAGTDLLVDHGDLFPMWNVAGLHGTIRAAAPDGAALGTRLGPFVGRLRPTAANGAVNGVQGHRDGRPRLDLHLILTAWLVLGAVERALELAVEHVTGRVQFGQTLSSFQAVQFQLADAAVGVDGLRELCRFALWRWWTESERCRPDSLAVRLHALDVGRAVLRTSQQLHGASGVCDEYDISVLCRHLQPALRLPFGAERAAEELADAVARHGFAGLFDHGGAGSVLAGSVPAR
ncbi:MAG TPA: acyl-CoA dehydrogenase family protein [Acidimicrobiales bacterium]|nr:acyl-CoA dehydrogenase family protein [Acidimicrobiales bacterium]